LDSTFLIFHPINKGTTPCGTAGRRVAQHGGAAAPWAGLSRDWIAFMMAPTASSIACFMSMGRRTGPAA
jgi:hypothetical protein